MPVLGAFDRRRPPVVGRQEAKFTHQASRWNLDADFGHQEISGDGQKHLVSLVALLEQNIALAIFALGHEWLEPFPRRVALCCATRLLDEVKHLTEADGIDRQEQQIQEKSPDVSGE